MDDQPKPKLLADPAWVAAASLERLDAYQLSGKKNPDFARRAMTVALKAEMVPPAWVRDWWLGADPKLAKIARSPRPLGGDVLARRVAQALGYTRTGRWSLFASFRNIDRIGRLWRMVRERKPDPTRHRQLHELALNRLDAREKAGAAHHELGEPRPLAEKTVRKLLRRPAPIPGATTRPRSGRKVRGLSGADPRRARPR